jgi:cytochrome c-type biogenesis protein CcmH
MALRRLFHILLVASLIVCAGQAFAVQPDEIMGDATKEARARALSRELRCMVCQNQSIDDSDAPLARDLRLLVRERIAAGDTDVQVIDFLTARYGAFVLLRPRFEAETLILWLLPPLVLAGGAALLWVAARRRRTGAGGNPQSVPLSAQERAELKELLAGKEISPGSDARDRSITKV